MLTALPAILPAAPPAILESGDNFGFEVKNTRFNIR